MKITKSTQEINTPTININNLLIPEIKQEIIPLTEFYTPNSPDQTSAFFDDSTQLGRDRLHDYTDIGGLFNEQSLILGRENNTNNNERVEIEINGNLINFEPEIANQALKLPLKEVAKLVLEFDGNNITLGEYIAKLKQAKGIISVTDKQNLVQVLKIKLKRRLFKLYVNYIH